MHTWQGSLKTAETLSTAVPVKTCELLRIKPFQDAGKFNLSIRRWNSISKTREDSDVGKVKQEKKEERFENQPKWNEMKVILFNNLSAGLKECLAIERE